MANKEIHYLSDNGTMFWPATTTTAIIDPTSQYILSDILNKKVSVEVAGNIASTVLPPIILESITTNSTAAQTSSGKTYFCPDLGKIRHYYSMEISQNTVQVVPEDTDPSPKLIYYDKGTDKFYRWDATNQEMVNIVAETSSEEPTFLDIDLADLNEIIRSVFLTEYYSDSREDPLPSNTFEDSEGKYKEVILRIRVLEEDNPEGVSSGGIDEDYWNFSLKLTPLALDTEDNAWTGYNEYFFGSFTYFGFIYSAYISKDINSNYSIGIQKIKLENLGIITSLSAYEDVPVYPTTGDDINIAFGKINRIVQSHEEVTARALLDLNNRIQNLPSGGGIQSTTWSALKTLRDGENLTPGQLYKITDYTCTTTQVLTYSAGHVFDIIVLALSESSLSGEAWADHHEGDTYFSNCKLGAWELKYCLDNDTTRFGWADDTNGRGIIYYMKDEWGNECSYDFKNIQFDRSLTDGVYDEMEGDNYHAYTFNYWDSTNEVCKDATLALNNVNTSDLAPVRNNVIKSFCGDPAKVQDKFRLNDIVSLLTDSYGISYNNIFENDCYDMTLESAYDNNFGAECKNIIAGYQFRFNVLGVRCLSLTFGDSSGYNQLGNYTNDCTFGNSFNYNNLGIYCNHFSFGNNSRYHTIGAACSYVNLNVDYTESITIDSGNKYITLTTSQTPTSNNRLRNIRIASGVNNTSTRKTISHNTLNDTFLTTYKPANSVEISV